MEEYYGEAELKVTKHGIVLHFTYYTEVFLFNTKDQSTLLEY